MVSGSESELPHGGGLHLRVLLPEPVGGRAIEGEYSEPSDFAGERDFMPSSRDGRSDDCRGRFDRRRNGGHIVESGEGEPAM